MFKRIARFTWRQVIRSGAAMQGLTVQETEDHSCFHPAPEVAQAYPPTCPVQRHYPHAHQVRLTDVPWTAREADE